MEPMGKLGSQFSKLGSFLRLLKGICKDYYKSLQGYYKGSSLC